MQKSGASARCGAAGTASRFALAADDVRFQLGQADRFRAGLIRAGASAATYRRRAGAIGLTARAGRAYRTSSPRSIRRLIPKSAQQGSWQFLRSTGRRFLRINSAVDERLDPFRETEAAAQLLAYNYRLLGQLATGNHGLQPWRRGHAACP